ncbi:MAG: DUF4870 domain-containing protein [Polyangiaceae bacterium]|nr:DUF4870 domain-containing protein [Polyangiaceae bacterium]
MSRALAFPTTVTPSERLAATFAHAGTCFFWFVAPLVVYLLARRKSPAVRAHAFEALLWSGIGTLVALATCGLAIPVFLVFHIIAAWRAWNGEDPSYPALTDFMRGWRST